LKISSNLLLNILESAQNYQILEKIYFEALYNPKNIIKWIDKQSHREARFLQCLAEELNMLLRLLQKSIVVLMVSLKPSGCVLIALSQSVNAQ
jgi:hypothetical protein